MATRVGLVGAGFIGGRNLEPLTAQDGVEVVGVAALRTERAGQPAGLLTDGARRAEPGLRTCGRAVPGMDADLMGRWTFALLQRARVDGIRPVPAEDDRHRRQAGRRR